MAIPAISAALSGIQSTAPAFTKPAAATSAAAAPEFDNAVLKAVDQLEATQQTADNLAVSAATGKLTDVHDYLIASTKASLATELTVAVRNKAVEAFNEIMRMQV
jgi:flagellar hook-basal body complex protein FliE